MAPRTNHIYATGRRKTSAARVYLTPAKEEDAGKIVVNGKTVEDFFSLKTTQALINKPLELAEQVGKLDFNISVSGGGTTGQAGAVSHGISRALILHDPELRALLKKEGLLTRDARKVERKKAGRHKARKKPQFSKR